MRKGFVVSVVLALLLLPPLATAEPVSTPPPIDIKATVLGDTLDGIATRIDLRFKASEDTGDLPLVTQGSILQQGKVVRNFRFPLPPGAKTFYSFVISLPPGTVTVEARVMVPLEESAPVILAKGSRDVTLVSTGKQFVAAASDTADALIAEGAAAESAGAVRIRAPRRDVAPNLFIVDVDVKPPVQKVEFWVEGKKISSKNAPPYRAELDLGQIPRRVEVRAVGYDTFGRYVDADAWVVNERDNPVEIKITRTVTGDGISHFKLSLQNHDDAPIARVEFLARDTKLAEWTSRGPFALDLPGARLAGFDFVRASVYDAAGIELASDLLFLNGDRFTEEVLVNFIELPIALTDRNGAPVLDAKQEELKILEEGKPQKISTFNLASNLPLSVGVLVDHSGSMKPRIALARSAALDFFQQIIGSRDKAFFGGFSWQAATVSPFLSDLESLRRQVAAMPDAEGGTALYDAIVTGLYKFRDMSGRRALVVVTDGEDTVSRVSYDEMLTYVRAARIPLYFIGIGLTPLGGGTIKTLAAETGGVVYLIRSADRLKETYAKLEKELRSQYLVGYNSESTKKDQKYRTVEVKIARPGVQVRTIRGYIP